MDMYQKREMRKNKKMNEDTKSLSSTSINWYPGHMAKTKREVKERIDLIDIVYEIIDARMPLSSKNNDINDLIKNKPRILIMTKKDLCDLNVTNKWIEYYKKQGYEVVLLDLTNNPNMKIIFESTNRLLKDKKEKELNKGINRRKTRALVLGIPNVGKSTFINRLVGKKVTNVGNKPGVTKKLEWIRINNEIELLDTPGNKPGVTKGKQWIRLNKGLELLDTPGILWPKLDNKDIALNLASLSSIKEEILDIEEVAIYIVEKMLNLYPKQLKERYKIDNYNDIVDILDKIGYNIGAIRNKEVDYERVYTTIINDLKQGRLGKITFDNMEE